MTGPEGVVTRVADLTDVSLPALPDYTEEDLGPTVLALKARVNSPGTSISGYNGAGALARDATVDLLVET
jgi:hypothetical protein